MTEHIKVELDFIPVSEVFPLAKYESGRNVMIMFEHYHSHGKIAQFICSGWLSPKTRWNKSVTHVAEIPKIGGE